MFAGYDEYKNRLDRPEPERFSVPRYELFRLGGREALRAIGEDDDSIGTHEIHITNEYFRPIFRNRDFEAVRDAYGGTEGIADEIHRLHPLAALIARRLQAGAPLS